MNRTVLAVVAVVLILGAALVLLRPPASPVTLADCRFALGETNRTNCVTSVAVHMFGTDPDAAITFTETQLPNALDRDFVYLQVTLTIDAKTPKYCMKIVDKMFQQQCLERVKRPHLDDDHTLGPQSAGPQGAGPLPGGPPRVRSGSPPP